MSENDLCGVFFRSFHVSVNFKKSLGNAFLKNPLHIFSCSEYPFGEFKSMCLIVKLMKSNMKETGDLKIICPICGSK